MNTGQRAIRTTTFVTLLLLSWGCMIAMELADAGNAYADAVNGKWCRQEGGRVVDVIKLTSTAHGLTVTLHEGENAPKYGEGFGMLKDNNLSLAIILLKTNKMVFVEGTVEGSNLRWRSFNLDGTFRWEGSYYKCN